MCVHIGLGIMIVPSIRKVVFCEAWTSSAKIAEACQYSSVFLIENEINLFIFNHVSEFRKNTFDTLITSPLRD